jgi:hypothetical protein
MMLDRYALRALAACSILLLMPAFAQAQTPNTPIRPDAVVFFTDLKDGAVIPPKLTLKFGASNFEVVPAAVKKANSGHHHLLIDSPVPPLGEPIPSDPRHLHFGRGQTEAELVLAPGPHTLQLLLGDHDHVPHNPPIMSAVVRVTVSDKATAPGRTASLPDSEVYFIGLPNGSVIPQNLTVRFGLRNMGVAPAGVVKAGTGHHHLIIDRPTPALGEPIASDPNHLHFGRGETEKKITLAPGRHTLQLVLGDQDHIPHDPPVMSQRIEVRVVRPHRQRRW